MSFVDLAPTLLSIIGVQPPDWMQGHAFAGKFQTEPQPFIFGFRGRMDERYDCVRSVTDGRYVYLRNYMPHLSQAQHVAYQFVTPTTRVWRKLFDDGKATPAQSIFWQAPKAPEELYDLQSDPDEVVNLASSPQHAEALARLRRAQEDLALKIRDVGLLPEGEMHRRSAGASPYDMGHDPGKFPVARITAAAGDASSMKSDEATMSKLKAGCSDADPAVRWWSVMGALMRGKDGAAAMGAELARALADESPLVQVAANWAVAKHGSEADSAKALLSLVALADWGRQDVFTSIAALNAIGDLGEKSKTVVAQIKALPAKGESPDKRFGEYVPRLLADLGGAKPEFNDAGEPKVKKGRAKRQKGNE